MFYEIFSYFKGLNKELIKTYALHPWLVWLFLVIITIQSLIWGFLFIGRDLSYIIGDQGAYLETATHLKNGEGFVFYGLDPHNPKDDLVSTENNRHPLYILLLSLFASEEPIFFFKAKLINLFTFLVLLLYVFFLAKKMFGDLVAMGGTFLVFTSRTFNYFSNTVACEPLLVLFTFLAWYFIVKGFKEDKYLILGGVFSGLAYLTKGSGLLIAIAFILSSLIIYKRDVINKKRGFLLYLLFFLLVSSPLLLRNIAQFKDPFYNFATTHLFWGNTTFFHYLKEHSLAEIMARLCTGVSLMTPYFIQELSISSKFIGPFLSILLLLFFVTSIDVDEDRERRVFTLFLFSLFYLSVCWFTYMVRGWCSRFLLPIFPVIYLYSMRGVFLFLEDKVTKIVRRETLNNSLALLLIILSLFFSPEKLINLAPLSSLLDGSFIPPRSQRIIGWLKLNTTKEDVVCFGPDDQFMYNWITQRKMVALPSSLPFEQVNDYLRKYTVKYIIITRDTLRYRQEILGRFLFWDEGSGLVQHEEIQGWRLVYRDRDKPTNLLIYEFNLKEEDQG